MVVWSPVVSKGFEVSAMSMKGNPAGTCPELARLVRQVTGDVASRVASRRAGISHDTVIRMWTGDRVSEGMILRFSQGYGIDPNPLLEAAGYPPLSQFKGDPPPPNVVETKRQPDPEPPHRKIERIPVFPMPEGYNDLDDPIVQAAAAGAEEAYKTTFKSIADALRHARRWRGA